METAVVDEQVKPVSKITDVIYPMYIPQNTHLTSQNKVTKEDGEVIMLTFEEKTIYFNSRNSD